MPKDTLFINSYNPFAEVTLKTRVRQLLHTHQGRDKLFKVLMYLIRIILWYRGINANPHFMGHDKDAEFTVLERNLMTIQNARRLFRVGRFVAEFVRIRVTLIKCSELLYTTSRSGGLLVFLQSQMIGDIAARLMMCIKSVCDDVAYLARKGFLHSKVEDRLMAFSIKFYLPVLLIDCYLNTTRLAQGLVDASAPEQGSLPVGAVAQGGVDASDDGNSIHHTTSSASDPPSGEVTPPAAMSTSPGSRKPSFAGFSLLSRYDVNDKLRRRLPTPQAQGSAPRMPSRKGSSDQFASGDNLDTGLISPRHTGKAKPLAPDALSRLESSMIANDGGKTATAAAAATATAPTAAALAEGENSVANMSVRSESFVYDASTYATNVNCDPNTVITYKNAHGGHDESAGSGDDTEKAALSASVVAANDEVEIVGSYWALLWKDFEIHWMCVTELKILLDLFVSVSIVRAWSSSWNGPVSIAGFVSGLLSVYRVWTYGR